MLRYIVGDLGGYHLSVSAKKQRVLKIQSELGQAAADCWLSDIQALRRPGHTFFLVEHSEDHQAIQVELREGLGIKR